MKRALFGAAMGFVLFFEGLFGSHGMARTVFEMAVGGLGVVLSSQSILEYLREPWR